MPNQAKFGEANLTLNGMGIREATVFNVDVYVAGLYLEKASKNPEEILGSDQVKHLRLRLVRDVSRDEMLEALQEGFARNAGGDLPKLQDRMNQFSDMIPELSEGDMLAFTYVPDKGMMVHHNRKLAGTIEGEDFARVFYSIWLGSAPPDEGLRRGLLGGPCG